jgi:ribosomal protein S18 acetylase RimI-like enzyme
MIEIRKAKGTDVELLALIGRLTYVESHSHFIDDKNDLTKYINEAFSVSKTKQDLNSSKNLFYIIYANNLPIGYTKLVLNEMHKSITSQNICRLEKIYILNEFIPLKIGQRLLTFIENKAKELKFDTMWLTVYTKNKRAIRFYERNDFNEVGKISFLVNKKDYINLVFSKKL